MGSRLVFLRVRSGAGVGSATVGSDVPLRCRCAAPAAGPHWLQPGQLTTYRCHERKLVRCTTVCTCGASAGGRPLPDGQGYVVGVRPGYLFVMVRGRSWCDGVADLDCGGVGPGDGDRAAHTFVVQACVVCCEIVEEPAAAHALERGVVVREDELIEREVTQRHNFLFAAAGAGDGHPAVKCPLPFRNSCLPGSVGVVHFRSCGQIGARRPG